MGLLGSLRAQAFTSGQAGLELGRFARFIGLASLRCAHQVNHQYDWHQTVKKKGHNGSQHGACAVGGFGHRHHEHHVNPTNHHQIHSVP
ncbi:MAG: hypothetical protein KGZ70_00945 [Hydrogenophaga sp.]|nr:hypothetical protein [Hydrogenophaga sp.]